MQKEFIGAGQIVLETLLRFWPVWLALIVTVGGGWFIRHRLGSFGRLYGSRIGMAGLCVVLFWIYTAMLAPVVAPYAANYVPIDFIAIKAVKASPPGIINPENGGVYLWGGDNNARDVFSRVVWGSRIVLIIAPAATLIAYMVGSTLGLPAGYYTGRIDAFLSFLANLVLAFPVILLFYLLVTPEIRRSITTRGSGEISASAGRSRGRWRRCSSCFRSSSCA